MLFDAGRLGHPFTFKNEQNTKSVQATVLENCRVTTMETAENCALVLVQHMWLLTVNQNSTKYVQDGYQPTWLTSWNKTVTSWRQHVQQFCKGSDAFTDTYSQVQWTKPHHYQSKSKYQSMQWKHLAPLVPYSSKLSYQWEKFSRSCSGTLKSLFQNITLKRNRQWLTLNTVMYYTMQWR